MEASMDSDIRNTPPEAIEIEDNARRDFLLTAASIGVVGALPFLPLPAEAKGRNKKL